MDIDAPFHLDPDLYPQISDDAPAGVDVQQLPSFAELRAKTRVKPGRYDPISGKDGEPEYPAWAALHDEIVAYLKQSKHAVLLVYVACAELARDGFPGLAKATHFVRQTLDEHWAHLYPLPDEDGDTYERVGLLKQWDDPKQLSRMIDETVLGQVPLLGSLTIRTLRIAAGQIVPNEDEPVFDSDGIREMVAANETVGAALATAAEAIAAAQADFEAIVALIGERSEMPLSIPKPLEALKRAASLVQPFAAAPATSTDATADADTGGLPAADSAATAGAQGQVGSIKSDQDAHAMIDAVLAFYDENDRSSPIPAILLRLRALLGRPFEEVVKKIAPDDPADAALKLDDERPEREGDASDAETPPPPLPEGVIAAAHAVAAAHTVLQEALDQAEALRQGTVTQNTPADDMNAQIEDMDSTTDHIAQEAAADDLDAVAAEGASEQPAPVDLSEPRAALSAAIDTLQRNIEAAKKAAAPSENGGKAVLGTSNEVKGALEKLATFYKSKEPGSPVSFFFRRTASFVNMPFPDIVQELAPEGGTDPELFLNPRTRDDR